MLSAYDCATDIWRYTNVYLLLLLLLIERYTLHVSHIHLYLSSCLLQTGSLTVRPDTARCPYLTKIHKCIKHI